MRSLSKQSSYASDLLLDVGHIFGFPSSVPAERNDSGMVGVIEPILFLDVRVLYEMLFDELH